MLNELGMVKSVQCDECRFTFAEAHDFDGKCPYCEAMRIEGVRRSYYQLLWVLAIGNGGSFVIHATEDMDPAGGALKIEVDEENLKFRISAVADASTVHLANDDVVN